MTPREELERARYIDRQIDAKIKTAEALRSHLMKSPSNMKADPVMETPDPHRTEKLITKIMDLEKEIDSDIDELVDLKAKIYRNIQAVDDPLCKMLLEMRYLNNEKWEDIADDLGKGLRWVYSLHGRALQLYEEIFEECSKTHYNAQP